MIDREIAGDLDRLADDIRRMRPPQNHNPEAFHEDRSELASRARKIAAQLRAGPKPKPAIAETPAPIGRQAVSHATRHIEGRTVLVLTRRKASDHPFY